jgi:hypothetical protein
MEKSNLYSRYKKDVDAYKKGYYGYELWLENKLIEAESELKKLQVVNVTLIPKNELTEHLENCLKQIVAQTGNGDYQRGYRQSIADFIDVIKLRWGN